MKIYRIALRIFGVFLLTAALMLVLPGQAVSQMVEVGELAPYLSAKTLEGEVFSLPAYRGRVVLLSFWTTWCYKCRAEMKFLQELREELPDTVVIIGVSEETEYFGVNDVIYITQLMEQWEVAFPTILDEGKRIWDTYGLKTLPTSIIIDHQGRVQLVETYFYSESEANIKHLASLLSSLVGEKDQ
jgi:peroxiredoxin